MLNSKKLNDKRKDVFNESKDDFEPPIVFKKFKSSSNNTITKRTKKKKNNKNQLTLHQVYETNFGYTDVNADHLQLALALSRSMSEESSCTKEEFPLSFPKAKKKKTLLEFGFQTDRPKMCVQNKMLRREPVKTNKKSKFRYITPILMMRTQEERESLIQSKLSRLLMGHNEVISCVNEKENFSPEVSSEELKKLRCHSCSIFKLNSEIILSDEKRFEVQCLDIEKVRAKSGFLLKDWKKIPFRDHTPERFKTEYIDPVIEKDPELNPQNLNREIESRRDCTAMQSFESDMNISNKKNEEPIEVEYNKRDGSVSPDLFGSDISFIENDNSVLIQNSGIVKKNFVKMFSQEKLNDKESNFSDEKKSLKESRKENEDSNILLNEKVTQKLLKNTNSNVLNEDVIVLNSDDEDNYANDEHSRLFSSNSSNLTCDTMLNFQKSEGTVPASETSSLEADSIENIFMGVYPANGKLYSHDFTSELRAFTEEHNTESFITDIPNASILKKLNTNGKEDTLLDNKNELRRKSLARSSSFLNLSDEEICVPTKTILYAENSHLDVEYSLVTKSSTDVLDSSISRAPITKSQGNSSFDKDLVKKNDLPFNIHEHKKGLRAINDVEINGESQHVDLNVIDLDSNEENSDIHSTEDESSHNENEEFLSNLKVDNKTNLDETNYLIPTACEENSYNEIVELDYSIGIDSSERNFESSVENRCHLSDPFFDLKEKFNENFDCLPENTIRKEKDHCCDDDPLEEYFPSKNNISKDILGTGNEKHDNWWDEFFDEEKQSSNRFPDNSRSPITNTSTEQFSKENLNDVYFKSRSIITENVSDFDKMNTPSQKTKKNCSTPFRRYASFSLKGTPKNSTVFTKQKSESEITPKGKFIVKTDNVTPMVNYNALSTPEIVQELGKFGLKPLKRKRGINLLRHIYESTHPKVEIAKKSVEESPGVKRRKSNGNSPLKMLQDLSHIISASDAIFERQRSSKIATCQVPLQIVWYNFLNENPAIFENILLYEPLQVEVIHKMLKELGYKFHIQDLITFLDQKCITIRVAQGQ